MQRRVVQRFEMGDKVRVKQEADSEPVPQYICGQPAVVVHVYNDQHPPKFREIGETFEAPQPYYRIRIETRFPDEEAEHDVFGDWLEPKA